VHQEKKPEKSSITQLITLLTTVGAVQLISSYAASISLFTLIFLSSVLAIPIWFYKVEYSLFARRAVLSAGAKGGSYIKDTLWLAQFSKAFTFLVSFTFALLLIAFSSLFQFEHWLVIYIDVLVIVAIIHFSRTMLQSQSKEESQGIFERKFLHLINLILITLIISSLDFFVIGAPDIRGMELQDIFQNEFNHYTSTAENKWSGWLIGAKAGLDSLGWYFMQVYIPEIPDTMVKIIAWLLFIVPSAISVAFILFILLGSLSLLEHKEKKDWKVLGETIASKSFMVTLLVLAIFYFYGTYAISTIDWSKVSAAAKVQISKINFCDRDAISDNKENIAHELNSQIKQQAQLTEEEINLLIEEQLAPIFVTAEQGVDKYLDWYYSVTGEYHRLAMGAKQLATGSDDFVVMMSEKTQLHLFDETGVSESLDALDVEITQLMTQRLLASESNTLASSQKLLAEDTCTFKASTVEAKGLEGDLNSAGVMGYVTLGRLGAKEVSRRVSTAIVGKALAKGATKVVAKTATKAVAKKVVTGGSVIAGATTGATAGAAVGSVVPIVGTAIGGAVGGVIGAAAAWFTVDKVLIEAEEFIYRDEMRDEMLASLNERRELLEEELKVTYASQVRGISMQLQSVVSDTFIPARDGI